MTEQSKKQQILDLAKQKGVIRSADAEAKGLPREYLSRLTKEGRLVREKRGVYYLPDYQPNESQSLVQVAQYIPDGVICLLSALRFYGLTMENPFEVWVAIENKSYLPKVDYPPVRAAYYSGLAFSTGVIRQNIQGIEVPIYSPAKTVADCFKYRNKIGLNVAIEALRDAWDREFITVDEVLEYADICRVKKVMLPYLQSMV